MGGSCMEWRSRLYIFTSCARESRPWSKRPCGSALGAQSDRYNISAQWRRGGVGRRDCHLLVGNVGRMRRGGDGRAMEKGELDERQGTKYGFGAVGEKN